MFDSATDSSAGDGWSLSSGFPRAGGGVLAGSEAGGAVRAARVGRRGDDGALAGGFRVARAGGGVTVSASGGLGGDSPTGGEVRCEQPAPPRASEMVIAIRFRFVEIIVRP
ncbi:MAG: hypothetical protein D6744_08640 [Planctomycetota bacterium]|nr:MAG: hypothetical protein D6744_08640 [Planctomycetota bacterium]